ncbi:MAG TPA: formate dehydrogenase subunit gamma [Thermoanaerobaculia bacterium]|nr:formate dehydrogenase subunit gamma [Thermoanaerobaculia bacterium]
MTTAKHPRPVDRAVIAAQSREDVVVGNEIVRHDRASRLIHWTVSLTFFLCLFTGMPIWTPVFGWMASLFGGLTVCRVIHPWTGAAFFLSTIVMFFYWLDDMHLEPGERKAWVSGGRAMRYMRYETDDTNVGKYNGGQKLQFWLVCLAALGLLLSGLMMWFPRAFPRLLMELAYVIHDVTFVLFAMLIVFHIYLGTAAEPGTFGSMTRGTVTKAWARLHHGRWYRDVTGEERHR